MKTAKEAYLDFIKRLTHLISKNPQLINTTLSNIFTIRLIGNKTHGDLAEIAISEFINQYMDDFKSLHVGKDLFRAKKYEEDIRITNKIHNIDFAISLKAYGVGPLQLSTDKHFRMFPRLKTEECPISDPKIISALFEDVAFSGFSNVNVLPLIYDEKKKRCNIMVFDFEKAKENTAKICFETGKQHQKFRFYDKLDGFICEVRYGDKKANALQRGFWTDTKKESALQHGFTSITKGWVDYSENRLLVELFAHALIATRSGHAKALENLKIDIQAQKENVNV
jgi:hypothetical protein